jgi:nucleotide-binding universal stress UspA family protein
MFEKVLIPTDFSDEADRVLSYAKGLKEFGLKSITLVHVVDIGRAVVWPLPPTITAAIETRLEERRGQLEDEGFIARSMLLEGNPSDEILRTAEADDYSMIVTGSNGKRLIEEILLGSVSEAVSREAKIPVLLIRYDILKEIERRQPLEQYARNTFRKILFPSDFSRPSKHALEVVKSLKRVGVQEVTAVHIVNTKSMETERQKKEEMEACDIECAKIARELDGSGLKVESICRAGDPLVEILSVAGEVDASLIVMGSHGKGVVREWLVGSVSLNIIRTADRPALIVHES